VLGNNVQSKPHIECCSFSRSVTLNVFFFLYQHIATHTESSVLWMLGKKSPLLCYRNLGSVYD
jgi:hypothetical protein